MAALIKQVGDPVVDVPVHLEDVVSALKFYNSLEP